MTELPPFELRDLAGKPVTAASLKGKPTLINFYFAQCVPCILEVGPLNGFAARTSRDEFSRGDLRRSRRWREPSSTRYKFRWRVVPDAREFIDRMRVKQYPMMALFDASGRLLGTRRGGVRDELEAANCGAAARALGGWVAAGQQDNRRPMRACQRTSAMRVVRQANL